MARKAHIKIKRVYDEPAASDGRRVLVDRIWPRGLRKEQAALDDWLKDIAPSAELRKRFGHSVDRWEEFRERYEAELERNRAALEPLVELCRRGDVTLLFAARDEEHNNAVVLRDVLAARLKARDGR